MGVPGGRLGRPAGFWREQARGSGFGTAVCGGRGGAAVSCGGRRGHGGGDRAVADATPVGGLVL